MRKLMLILMMFVCVMSFAETKDVTIQGSMGKLVAKMQIPKMKSGKCQMVIIIHGRRYAQEIRQRLSVSPC